MWGYLVHRSTITPRNEHPAYGHRRIAIALGRNKKAVLRVMKLFHQDREIEKELKPRYRTFLLFSARFVPTLCGQATLRMCGMKKGFGM